MELWNYHHWRRAQELRGLVAYFRERDVTDLASLRAWAEGSTSKDFVGHIKGLGPTVYQWLVMRAGVETIKPDVHVLRFVSAAIGRPVNEAEAVHALEEVAGRLGDQLRVCSTGRSGSTSAPEARGLRIRPDLSRTPSSEPPS